MRPTSITIAAALASITFAGITAPARAQAYKQVYSFPGGKHGSRPAPGLVKFRGKLYGSTYDGGLHNCHATCGTVFALDPATGKETSVYEFQGGSDGANPFGSLVALGGLLYGTTDYGGTAQCGTVF